MAVVNTKSTPVTNLDATPFVENSALVDRGRLRSKTGTLESVSGDDIASVYRFVRCWSGDRINQVLLYCDDVGSTTIADFGLYRIAADGGAVVDADFFASAVSLKDGALNAVDITHESGVYNIDDTEKSLWQGLGLSADPKVFYDIAATLTAASDAAGTISLKVTYVDGT